MMEFFVSGDEVWYQDESGLLPLTEGSPVVSVIIDKIREFYPQAYASLCDCYAKSRQNASYFNFLVARRFCKCNFGNLDHTRKDMDGMVFNIERVSCPLLGECPYEGIICMPSMSTCLSKAEKRVMKLLCDGRSRQEIADELYISPNTVKRHISTSYIKTHTRNCVEFVKYAKDNSIF